MFAELPACLYRYRPLAPKGRRTKAKVIQDELDLIREGFIWTSHPKELNDPFDCRPISSPAHQRVIKDMMDRLLIGSMSAVAPDDVMAGPLWSHYANNHRGICVEYPLDSRSSRTLPIYKVKYVNERLDIRTLNPDAFRLTSPARIGVLIPQNEMIDPENNVAIEEMTRKSMGWEIEKEWRYIWPSNVRQSEAMDAEHARLYGPLFFHKVFISKPTRIILGANMGPGIRDLVSDELKKIGVQSIVSRFSDSESRSVID